jgi:hypothetical protein
MAKIETLEFNIDGEVYKTNINVNKHGIFTMQLNWEVSDAIGLKAWQRGVQEASTLSGLTSEVLKKYNDYLTSLVVDEIFIGVEFKSGGKFHKHPDYSKSFTYRDSLIQFDFDLYHKRTASTGTVRWNKVKATTDSESFGTILYDGEYFSDMGTYHGTDRKMIPYSKTSVATLEKARNGLDSIATILYEFIKKEPEEMSRLLSGGNLLGAKKEDLKQ